MKKTNLGIVVTVLSLVLFSSSKVPAAQTNVIQSALDANLRKDIFGNSYTNIYGITTLAVGQNNVNDDRFILEFSTISLPQNAVIYSATLHSIYLTVARVHPMQHQPFLDSTVILVMETFRWETTIKPKTTSSTSLKLTRRVLGT